MIGKGLVLIYVIFKSDLKKRKRKKKFKQKDCMKETNYRSGLQRFIATNELLPVKNKKKKLKEGTFEKSGRWETFFSSRIISPFRNSTASIDN